MLLSFNRRTPVSTTTILTNSGNTATVATLPTGRAIVTVRNNLGQVRKVATRATTVEAITVARRAF